jgi:hypothetical protein
MGKSIAASWHLSLAARDGRPNAVKKSSRARPSDLIERDVSRHARSVALRR